MARTTARRKPGSTRTSLSLTRTMSWRASRTMRQSLLTLSLTPSGSEPISRRIGRCGKSRISCSMIGNRRILLVRHAEQNFEFRIVLPAEACVIFVGFAVEPADRFQDADWRSEIRRAAGRLRKNRTAGDDRADVVGEWRERQHQTAHRESRASRSRRYPLPMNTSVTPTHTSRTPAQRCRVTLLAEEDFAAERSDDIAQRRNRDHEADVFERQHPQQRKKAERHQPDADPHPARPASRGRSRGRPRAGGNR